MVFELEGSENVPGEIPKQAKQAFRAAVSRKFTVLIAATD
jgi:hypothetical protein